MSENRQPAGCDRSAGHELYDYGLNDTYSTPKKNTSWFYRRFATPLFYKRFWWLVYRASLTARRGRYDGQAWAESSHDVWRALERVGVQMEITGMQHVRELAGPCVFIGNHMSMFETIILPSILRPVAPVTFVVKQSLMEYPVFRHVLGARKPIAVSRTHPREDLKTVLETGQQRLDDAISVVVFPQTTRSDQFNPKKFNTIGIKLAARAGVPVIPIALITDAWGNGRWVKDLGPIDASKKVRIAFGPAIQVAGRGADQHQQVVDFISEKLAFWRTESPSP